jgi:hypothetical protein
MLASIKLGIVGACLYSWCRSCCKQLLYCQLANMLMLCANVHANYVHCSVARACKQPETRALILSHALLPDLLALLRGAQRAQAGTDEALIFVLAVMAYILCRDDALAERFPPASVTALAALLPGGDCGAVATPAKAAAAAASTMADGLAAAAVAKGGRKEKKLKLKRRGSTEGDARGGAGEADVVSQARLLLDR